MLSRWHCFLLRTFLILLHQIGYFRAVLWTIDAGESLSMPSDPQKEACAEPSQVHQCSTEESVCGSGLIVFDAAQGIKGFLNRIGQQANYGLISHDEVHRYALTSGNGEAFAAFF